MTEIGEQELEERMGAQVDLGEDLDWDDVVRRAGGEEQRRDGVRGWGRKRVLVAGAAALLAAGGTAAATGVFEVGDVISGSGFSGDADTVKETVAATGTTLGSGRWRITVFKSPQGTPCLKATLLDLRGRQAGGTSEGGYCASPPGLNVFSVGGKRDAARRGEVILFGTAPARARSVRLTAAGGVKLEAKTQTPTPGRTSYWLLGAAPNLRATKISWLDAKGRPGGPEQDVSARFEAPATRTVVLLGKTPAQGPFRMIAHESERLTTADEVLQPEGLPCLQIELLDPPADGTKGFGGCGEFPSAPGFSKGQHRYPSKVGEPAAEVLLYGRAPARADRVEIRHHKRRLASTTTHAGPAGVPSRFWYMAITPQRSRGRVYWIDDDTNTTGDSIAVFPP